MRRFKHLRGDELRDYFDALGKQSKSTGYVDIYVRKPWHLLGKWYDRTVISCKKEFDHYSQEYTQLQADKVQVSHIRVVRLNALSAKLKK